MQSPWRVRATRSVSKVGARPAAIVGTTRSADAAIIVRRLPSRSESGPQSHTLTATARTTAETVSPARAGPTAKSRPSSGRIACVEYIDANIPEAPSRNAAIPARFGAAPGGPAIDQRRCTSAGVWRMRRSAAPGPLEEEP